MGSFPPARLLAFALVAAAIELFLITFNLQTIKLLDRQPLDWWQWPFAYMDLLAKVSVLTLFLLALMRKQHLVVAWQGLNTAFSTQRFWFCFLLQAVTFVGLFYTTRILFASVDSEPVSDAIFIGWGLCAGLTLVLMVQALYPWSSLVGVMWRNKGAIAVAALISLLVWKVAKWSQSIWGDLAGDGLAGVTFNVVAWLITLGNDAPVSMDVAGRSLGLGDFVVVIAPECSGYEGIGLISAAIGLYLGLYHRELRILRALWLFPLGALLVWVLNCLRIAVLIFIGYFGAPDVAVGGFHSQAGWISFILTSVLLLWLASHSAWLQRRPMHKQRARAPLTLPVATLIPLVALLAATLLTSAVSAGFDYVYGIRVVVVVAVLIWVWPILAWGGWRPRWEALAAAVAVAGLWLLLHDSNPEANVEFSEALAGMGIGWAALWLVFRVVGSLVTVPIAEELAFRGYLLSRWSSQPVALVSPLTWNWIGVALSSLAFGALHGSWIAGTAAGLLYAVVRWRTGRLVDAVWAHGLTNALIFVYAGLSGEWWLL